MVLTSIPGQITISFGSAPSSGGTEDLQFYDSLITNPSLSIEGKALKIISSRESRNGIYTPWSILPSETQNI